MAIPEGGKEEEWKSAKNTPKNGVHHHPALNIIWGERFPGGPGRAKIHSKLTQNSMPLSRPLSRSQTWNETRSCCEEEISSNGPPWKPGHNQACNQIHQDQPMTPALPTKWTGPCTSHPAATRHLVDPPNFFWPIRPGEQDHTPSGSSNSFSATKKRHLGGTCSRENRRP